MTPSCDDCYGVRSRTTMLCPPASCQLPALSCALCVYQTCRLPRVQTVCSHVLCFCLWAVFCVTGDMPTLS